MRRTRRLFAKLCGFLRAGIAERELAREVDAHLALLADDFQRHGMTAEEAQQAAKRAYGNVEQVKELHRDERSFPALEQAWRDVRYACRNLARNPAFTLVIVLTLALGIGVNVTIFSAYNAVALKPLPVADPNEVMRLERWFKNVSLGETQYAFSYPEYMYCRDHNDVFAGAVAASWPRQVLVGRRGDGRRADTAAAQLVSANYFADLGIALPLGRPFLPEEDRLRGANAVAVISYPFWQRQFHKSPQTLGQILTIDGIAFTVIGIAPEDFTGTSTSPQVPDLWVPLSMQPRIVAGSDWQHEPDNRQLQILARIKASTTARRAQAEADTLIRQFDTTFTPSEATAAVTLQRTAAFGNTDDPRFKASIAALLLLVGSVLMVACANVANMLLARGAARQKEIGVRLALGASRGRIVRQLLVESVLLACIGGVAGVLASLWTTRLLWISLEQVFAGLFAGSAVFRLNLWPDTRVFAYALVLSFLTGILFGLWPAWQSSRPDLAATFKDAGLGAGRRWSRSRVRSFLIAMQVCVSMVLLIVSGLLLRGLVRSQGADPGYATHPVILLSGDFGVDVANSAARERRLLARLAIEPQVKSTAIGTLPLLGTWTPPIALDRPGISISHVSGKALASYASDAYFETLGIRLLRGRNFTSREAAEGAHVAVISRLTAQRFWPREDALGKRFKLDLHFRNEFTDFEVIGIAKDVRFANLTRIDPTHIYVPTGTQDFYGILVRARNDPQDALTSIRSAVAASDASLLPSMRLMTLEGGPLHLQRSLARICAVYASMLASVALMLAAIGIYGVVNYMVNQRVAEIGIRMALGANARDVLKGIVVDGLQPAFAGLVAGIAGGAALAWSVHTTLGFPGTADFFYGVPFYDPVTFGGLAGFLIFVTAMAAFAPARRAVRVDPMIALRYE